MWENSHQCLKNELKTTPVITEVVTYRLPIRFVLFLPFFCCLQIFPYHVQTKRFFLLFKPKGFCYTSARKKNFFFHSFKSFWKKENKKITILNDISEAFRARTSHTQIWLFFSHIYFELFNLENQFEWERHTNQK